MALSDPEIWEFVENFVKKQNNGISLMFAKYGWISGSDNNDVIQDIRVHCYETIKALEEEYGDSFDLSNAEIYTLIRKRTYGRYRADNWRNRSDRYVRKSDVLNIEPGSEGDIGIGYDEYIDSIGVYDTGLCSTFNDDEPDAGDYYEADVKAQEILDILLRVLPNVQAIAINDSTLGKSEKGHAFHHELADRCNVDRSTITRRIHSGIKLLRDFLHENNLSLDMPKEKLLSRLTDLVAFYRMSHPCCPDSNLFEFTIEDYLSQDDFEDIEIDMEHKKSKDKTQNKHKTAHKKNSRRNKESEILTIERYL